MRENGGREKKRRGVVEGMKIAVEMRGGRKEDGRRGRRKRGTDEEE